jgi:hypothetical protein
MTELELLFERISLEQDAAAVRALLLEEGGSAKADAYVLESRFPERLRAFKAAGGVL